MQSHLARAEYWAGRCWWRRRGSRRFGRWAAGTDMPPARASGSSGTPPPARRLWVVGRTRHPPLPPLPFSLLPPCPELHLSPSPSPRWRTGWCPGEPEGVSTGSLWTGRKEMWVHLFRKWTVKKQILDGLPWNIVLTFMVLWTLDSGKLLLFALVYHEVKFAVEKEIYLWTLDELPGHLVKMFMSPWHLAL